MRGFALRQGRDSSNGYVEERVPETIARRTAALRFAARRGSARDALVVGSAEPDGVVLTSDLGDLRALAAHSHGSHGVIVERARASA